EVCRVTKEVTITVADNGIGMSPETLARVFDAFSQAENTLARSKGGLGLGLALVKGLAELHDGQVEAKSAGIGQGATFVVRLPLTTVPPLNSTPESPPNFGGRKIKRVLIIEDNRDTAITMQMLIKRLGL